MMHMDRDVRLHDQNDRAVAAAIINIDILEPKPLLRFRNKLYKYTRHAFDGVVHYHEIPEPLHIDEIAREIQ